MPQYGVSPQQVATTGHASEFTSSRTVLRRSWGIFANEQIGSYSRGVTPFRAVSNSGDYLTRVNYACGGPNPVKSSYLSHNLKPLTGSPSQQCDNTNIAVSSCNPKFVADSSDYVRYRKLRAMNKTYSDSSFGGDDSNGSFVAILSRRR